MQVVWKVWEQGRVVMGREERGRRQIAQGGGGCRGGRVGVERVKSTSSHSSFSSSSPTVVSSGSFISERVNDSSDDSFDNALEVPEKLK